MLKLYYNIHLKFNSFGYYAIAEKPIQSTNTIQRPGVEYFFSYRSS